MGYYTDVVVDVYSLAVTEDERKMLTNAVALSLGKSLRDFAQQLRDSVGVLNLDVDSIEVGESLLFYSDTIKYNFLEEHLELLLDDLGKIIGSDVPLAYEVVLVGEHYTDITTMESHNCLNHWYVNRTIERH
jgi:hypothetical protein